MKKVLFFACTLLLLIACGGGDSGGGGSTGGTEFLNVSNVNIPGGNTTATLNIQASNNCEWVVSWSESWIRVSPTSGRGSQNVTITVSVNPSSSIERTAVITVKNTSGTIVRNVVVTQSANAESLELSTTSMTFTYAASNQDVTVTSNTHWTVTGTASWFNLSKTEGDNDGVVKISVSENTSENERTAVLTFKGASGAMRQLMLTQTGRSTDFTVSTTDITVNALAGSTNVTISGDARWTAQSNKDWVALSDYSGEGNKAITIAYANNTSEEARSAEITIKSSSKEEKIVITQQAATKPVVSGLQITDMTRNEANVTFSYTSMFPVTEYGVCFATTANPTINNSHTLETGSVTEGSYSKKLTGLTAGTTYYARAYAKSAVGISYSDNIEFKTAQGNKPNSGDNPQPGW